MSIYVINELIFDINFNNEGRFGFILYTIPRPTKIFLTVDTIYVIPIDFVSAPTSINFIDIIDIRISKNTLGEYIEIVSFENLFSNEKLNYIKILTLKLRILYEYMIELWIYSMNHIQQLTSYQKRFKDGQFNEKLMNYYEKCSEDENIEIRSCEDLNRNRMKKNLRREYGIVNSEVILDRMYSCT